MRVWIDRILMNELMMVQVAVRALIVTGWLLECTGSPDVVDASLSARNQRVTDNPISKIGFAD